MNGRARFRPILTASVVVALVALLLSTPSTARAATSSSLSQKLVYVGSPSFYQSDLRVLPGSTVSLHWQGGAVGLVSSGAHLSVTSTLPGFSSASVVTWPPGTVPAPSWTGAGWSTTSTAMTVTVPPSAAPGTQYQFQIVGCTRTQCVTIPKSTALVVLPSASWVTKPYSSDYSKVATFATPGEPFAATFMDSDNSMWNASEYSHNVIGVSSTAKKVKAPAVPDPSGAPSAFRKPFAFCGPKKCYSSSESALGESITTSNGWVWTTFGGWRVYANGQSDANKDVSGQPTSVYHRSMPPNRSEVVGYDPATGGFCVYLVPGSNTEVAGVAVTGGPSHPQVWFAASSGTGGEGSLDEFDPSAIGGGCNGRTTKSVVLPASVRKLVWPTTGGQWPTQIAIDPSAPTLWVSDFYGYGVNGTVYSEVDRIDISDPGHPEVAHRYVYPALDTTDYFGAKPWDIVAPPNSNYVYVADNGDAEIVRINKVTNQLDEAAIPLTSDLENAFGLAFSSGRLYFTLADDFDLSFGRPSTFGYLDLSSWPADGPPTGGVIYAGLAQVTDRTWANYRGIAVGPTGQVALTDNYQMIRLTPR